MKYYSNVYMFQNAHIRHIWTTLPSKLRWRQVHYTSCIAAMVATIWLVMVRSRVKTTKRGRIRCFSVLVSKYQQYYRIKSNLVILHSDMLPPLD